jgi:hypothetical protein
MVVVGTITTTVVVTSGAGSVVFAGPGSPLPVHPALPAVTMRRARKKKTVEFFIGEMLSGSG